MTLAVQLVSCQVTDEETEAQENEKLAHGHRAKEYGARTPTQAVASRFLVLITVS